MVTQRSAPIEHVSLLGFMPSWDPTSGVVADWLNASTGTESHNRIAVLIEELRQLGMAFDKALAQGGAESARQPPGVRRALDDLEKRHIAINRDLSRYAFAPAINRIWLGREWRLSAYSSPTNGEFSFKRRVHHKDKTSELDIEHTVTEADAALYVLILASIGEVDRLKNCENCFKWFHAQRSNQKFCLEGVCRKTKYASSPKFKIYRKLYMRKRRAEEKKVVVAKRNPQKGRKLTHVRNGKKFVA